ncbi:MAG: phage holin family protein [Bacteroidia bacterium]
MKEQNKIEEVTEGVKEYINTRYDLVVLKTYEKISNVGSEFISTILILKISGFALLLLSFAGALYISSVFNDTYTGFIIVGGGYLLISLILLLLRKHLLINPLRNSIIRLIFKKNS